jgi:hypothetical protein
MLLLLLTLLLLLLLLRLLLLLLLFLLKIARKISRTPTVLISQLPLHILPPHAKEAVLTPTLLVLMDGAQV